MQKIWKFFLVAVWFVAVQPGTLSAQNSGVGWDGYTRFLWKGTDSSILIWTLDSNLNYVNSRTYGPYFSWVPQAMVVGSDNYARILWKNTDGTICLWLVDPSLNFVSYKVYGPYSGWVADSISLNPAYSTMSLSWTSTTGQVWWWSLDSNLNYITSHGSFGPYFGYAAKTGMASKDVHRDDVANGAVKHDDVEARAAAAMKRDGSVTPTPMPSGIREIK
jgi:hypothetical protein